MANRFFILQKCMGLMEDFFLKDQWSLKNGNRPKHVHTFPSAHSSFSDQLQYQTFFFHFSCFENTVWQQYFLLNERNFQFQVSSSSKSTKSIYRPEQGLKVILPRYRVSFSITNSCFIGLRVCFIRSKKRIKQFPNCSRSQFWIEIWVIFGILNFVTKIIC